MEQTFRGKTFKTPVLIERTSYKTDYRLIPKDEEESYCKFDQLSVVPEKILPKYMDFPPIFKQLNIRESLNKGGPTKEDLQLEIVYNNRSRQVKYKIAEEGNYELLFNCFQNTIISNSYMNIIYELTT